MSSSEEKPFVALNIALFSVSDRRTLETDEGGMWLADRLQSIGHRCLTRTLSRPHLHKLRANVAACIADDITQVIVVMGGTGLGDTDISYQALSVLFDRPIEGFGELFRQLSFHDIGSSTLQSRAFAGIANRTAVFVLPSSPSAIELGWQKIIAPQLDARTRPCNLVASLKQTAAIKGA